MSHSWLVGRLVSGLGVASKAAALPLARLSPCETSAPQMALLAAGTRWVIPTLAAAPSSPRAMASACAPAASLVSASSTPNLAVAWLRQQPALSEQRAAGPCTPNACATAAAHYSTGTAATAVAAAATPPAAATGAAAAGSVGRDAAGGSSAAGDPGDAARESGAAASGEGDAGEDAAPAPEPKPDLVDKFLSLAMRGSGVQRRAERQDVLRDFQRHPADTGSPPVMVAMWTHRVRSLVPVFDSGRKQLPSIRHLEMLVHKRRRMLTWLRRTDFESYSYTISKLGLRDIYVPAGGPHRYREGVRASDPVDDDLNRLRFNFHTKYRLDKTSQWKRLRPQLVAEDPVLQAADAEAAVEDRQRRQQRREVAAQQRMAAEREREREQRK